MAQASGVGVVGPASAGVGPPAASAAAWVGQDMEDGETQPVVSDPMLGALLAAMPDQLAKDARGIRYICIASGHAPGLAQQTVAELYSPPHVAR